MYRTAVVALALSAGLLSAADARAHGGAEAAASLTEPASPGVVVDDTYTIAWTDADMEGVTGVTYQSFFYARNRPPPWPVWSEPSFLDGAMIAERIPLGDSPNRLTWDTSTVAAGAYWIWSIADDPDIENAATTIRFSPNPIIVAHPGDELHPSITVVAPETGFELADDEFEITWAAFDPDDSGTVTLEVGTSTDGSDLRVLATVAASAGAYVWDTSALDEGDYLIRATIEDERGLRFGAYARYPLLVLHRGAPARDGGIASDGGAVDAGFVDAGAPTPTPADDGCTCTSSASKRPWWLVFGALGLFLRRRRRDISPGRGRTSPLPCPNGTLEDR